MVAGGDVGHDGILEYGLLGCGHTEWDVGACAERGEGGDMDPGFLAIAKEFRLGQIGVHFDLEDFGSAAAVADEVSEEADAKVADANMFDEAFGSEVEHGFPGFEEGNVGGFHFGVGGIGLVEPTGRVARFHVDVAEGDGEVDEIEIEMIELKIAEGPFEGGSDMFGAVVGVPQLASDPEVVASAEAALEG